VQYGLARAAGKGAAAIAHGSCSCGLYQKRVRTSAFLHSPWSRACHYQLSVLPRWYLCCRLLLSIRDSVQHVDHAVTRELAFQEGVRHAQLAASSRYSLFLTVASAAAVASSTTAYLLMRRNAL
jgi:hypothetical protein